MRSRDPWWWERCTAPLRNRWLDGSRAEEDAPPEPRRKKRRRNKRERATRGGRCTVWSFGQSFSRHLSLSHQPDVPGAGHVEMASSFVDASRLVLAADTHHSTAAGQAEAPGPQTPERPHLAERMMTRASRSLASSSRDVRLVSWLKSRTFSAWRTKVVGQVTHSVSSRPAPTLPHPKTAPPPPASTMLLTTHALTLATAAAGGGAKDGDKMLIG